MAAPLTIGIDFGTTNTVVAVTDARGQAQVIRLATPTGDANSFRSALSFQLLTGKDGRPDRLVEAGPWAIESYLDDPLDTRFIQSFKSFAASAAFTETVVDSKRYTFEDLLAAFLLQVRRHAGGALDDLPGQVIVGRPVTFVGGTKNEALAIGRYEAAFARLGFTDIRYAYEPVGAAFYFARNLKEAATVLVADFGGGTSDFSVVRFEPSEEGLRSTALGRAGVGLAGDAFDYRIIDNLVSPELGKGGEYRSVGKVLPIPQRYYSAFGRWDQLALLRASRDMKDIRDMARTALEPDKLEAMIEVLDDNHGYALYQSVSALKMALSREERATFSFVAGSVTIEREVERATFEAWIRPELTAMQDAVDEALATSGVAADQIDRVFLTGGTSFVPAVRNIFRERFGEARIETGGEFESIASGLALIGRESDLTLWTHGRAAD